jgi:hypothetical protein
MSLHPQPFTAVPPETARVVYAAFPKGNVYMRRRDEIGAIYEDTAFAPLFSPRGQPADAPWLSHSFVFPSSLYRCCLTEGDLSAHPSAQQSAVARSSVLGFMTAPLSPSHLPRRLVTRA